MDTAERRVLAVFRSDLNRVNAWLVVFAVLSGGIIFAAKLFFAWRHGQWPGWGEVIVDSLLLPALAGVIWLIARILWVVYPVKILQGALRGYDMKGAFVTVPWRDIRNVGRIEQHGFAYLTIRLEGRAWPLTIPVWLEDMPGFLREVERQAGHEHPLVLALKKELAGR